MDGTGALQPPSRPGLRGVSWQAPAKEKRLLRAAAVPFWPPSLSWPALSPLARGTAWRRGTTGAGKRLARKGAGVASGIGGDEPCRARWLFINGRGAAPRPFPGLPTHRHTPPRATNANSPGAGATGLFDRNGNGFEVLLRYVMR